MDTLALAPGFADPVIEAQGAFRAVMEALARPGTLQRLPVAIAPPAPLTPALAAIALTLADHEAPLWLDVPLARVPAVADWLRFHTGARIVTDGCEAAFALIADPAGMPGFEAFALGEQAFPDRSTTLVLACERLESGAGLHLEGPGIRESARLAASPLPKDFLARFRANGALFPRGVDVLLTAGDRVAGLPRTTMIRE
ncbi:phosphonate C-P lyase system protein PhnH [Salinarimonas ramus]|uniref:Carbon-phosphorus lyase n=1 Tax=Salinarimonas ramus TaxID=690164 RepID=A0A917Q6F9_9HYPH|nr:phosphonate C-P lyase system protein PhnH [Salinarimonas ramus]GGK30179.1 carbon-phosphorus lyase [Salinarimonas ramus]